VGIAAFLERCGEVAGSCHGSWTGTWSGARSNLCQRPDRADVTLHTEMRRRPRQGELIRHRWEEHIVKTHIDHDSTLAAVPIGARPFSRQRPRHRAGIAAAVGVVSVALTGCSGSSPQPAESAQRSPTAAGEPQPGTCWVVPATSVADSDVRFDDSLQVPCTDRHTTETVTTYSLAEPSIDEAERLLLDCFDDVRVYLGIDEDSWVPWGLPLTCRARRRSPTAPVGCAATRSSRPPPTTAARPHHRRVRQGDCRRSTGRLPGLHRRVSREGRSPVRHVRTAAHLRTDRIRGHRGGDH
jgi:hypothetical protein